MDDRRGPSDGRDKARAGRPANRRTHRHPVYGGQARRETQYGPYLIGFVLVVLALAGFLYLGLNWATGQSRVASLASPPTATPLLIVAPAPGPSASPTLSQSEQTYVVKAGDNPASIAQQFRIKTEDLMAANNIQDPSKLQIGQTLKIPPGNR
jgi:LysM repeat protein